MGSTRHLHRSPGDERDTRAPIPALPASARGANPLDVATLQRAAGNRATAKLISGRGAPGNVLMRTPKTPQRRMDPRKVTVTVVPGRAMSGRQVAILVLQQLYGYSDADAEQRLGEWDLSGWPLTHPVDEKDKDKPITVHVKLPDVDPGEAIDVGLRAADFAATGKDEQQRINDEVDRRFWAKIGDRSRAKLGTGRAQQGARELWMRTRDEVLKDRDRVLVLPAPLLDFMEPGGEDIDPHDYQATLRIAEKAKGMTAGDWARYERNATATASDLGEVEQAVGQFAAAQARERSIADRVKGTESFFKSRYSNLATETEDFKQERLRHSLPRGFKDVAEYDAACEDYLRVFRDRAIEIAFLVLRASESVVRAERARYSDPAEIANTFADLSGMRDIVSKASVELQSLEDDDDGRSDIDKDQAEKDIMSLLRSDTEAERKRQVRKHPIFSDPELKTETLTKLDPQALAEALRGDAADRLHDIDQTRARVADDAEAVFQLDRVLDATKQEMGAEHGNILELIVDQHLKDIKNDHLIRSIATTVIAIGLTILTFGTGAVAVIAGGALLAQGVYVAASEVKQYGDAYAAAHTAFDAAQTVSADSPSAFWAAFSLIAAGFDGIALVNALKAVGKPLRLLEESHSFQKFDKALVDDLAELPPDLKAALTPTARAVLKRALRARPKLEALTRLLRRALTRAENAGGSAGGAKVAASVRKCAYVGAQMGMKEFDEFVAFLKAGARPIDLGKLSQEELAALRSAWESGLAKAQKARVAIEPGHAPPEGEAKDAQAAAEAELEIEELILGFANKAEVAAEVEKRMTAILKKAPERWDLVKAALRATKGKHNEELLGLIDAYMNALRDPKHWGKVLADAWELAANMPKPDMRMALMKLIKQRLGEPLEIPGEMSGAAFFDDYVITGRPLLDTPLRDRPHGDLIHMLQDLVIDDALGAGASARFRKLLGEAEGEVTRFIEGKPGVPSRFGAHRGGNANVTFLKDELKMRTGDYVWRFIYDLLYNKPDLMRLPQPEAVWPTLKDIFANMD